MDLRSLKRLKGKTSKKLLSENRKLSQGLCGRHMSPRSYFFASFGNVTDEVIMEYIEMQDVNGHAQDHDFTITG